MPTNQGRDKSYFMLALVLLVSILSLVCLCSCLKKRVRKDGKG